MINQNIDPGEVIRQLRHSRRLTQSQLAKIIGIDRTALSRVENGERELTARELIHIAGAFGEDICTVAGQRHDDPSHREDLAINERDDIVSVPTPTSVPTIKISGGWKITVGFEEIPLWIPASAR